jgi:hypothetical protein
MHHWSFGIGIFNFPNGQWFSADGGPVVPGLAAADGPGRA